MVERTLSDAGASDYEHSEQALYVKRVVNTVLQFEPSLVNKLEVFVGVISFFIQAVVAAARAFPSDGLSPGSIDQEWP